MKLKSFVAVARFLPGWAKYLSAPLYSTQVVEGSIALTLCCYHNAVLAVESSKHETSTL